MSLLDRFRLDGKTAIVTGASSGIGEQIALAFAAAGATVYAVARRADRLDELHERDERIVAWPGDLLDDDGLGRIVPAVVEHAGRLDVLVNNAGTSNIARAQDETTVAFREVVDLNLTAVFALSRDAGTAMIAQGGGGSIVNIASVLGMVGSAGLPQAGYAASKAGCVGLTRELASQWARHRIRVNALAPGWCESELSSEFLATDKGRASIDRFVPLRRAAEPDEIACAALFLASDASSYVTGAVVPVDGGWTAV
jgi:NAD(P)-dependent dehydrogenase (short-subunit alcohol dehydrogenase family)